MYPGLPADLNATPTSRFDDYSLHLELAAAAMPTASTAEVERTAADTYDAWQRWRRLPWTGTQG